MHANRILLGLLVPTLGVVAAACERTPAPQTVPVTATPSKTYTVKGRVDELPDPRRAGSLFQVHHEDIPEWTDPQGNVVGMKSMTMPFPPAPGVSLDGLAVGDEIEFTFEVRWDQTPPFRTVSVHKLSPGR